MQSPSWWVASIVVPVCQRPRTTTANATRSPLTRRRRLARARARARAASLLASSARAGSLRDAALRALIAHEDLVSEVVPDLLIDPRELGLEADLGDVAGPRQVDAVDALHGSRPRGADDDPVGESAGLLETVRDEDHRRSGRGPELKKLALHARARLDVERAARLLHHGGARLLDHG